MSNRIGSRQVLVAVTGAQGVGKSTFCEKLAAATAKAVNAPVTLLDGLGDQMRAQGLTVGSSATEEVVAAIFAAHMSRERQSPPGVVILDRCAVDASAYVNALENLSPSHKAMYQEVTLMMSKRLSYVVHLEMTGIFLPIKVNHETEAFRNAVARSLPGIIESFQLNSDSFYAADVGAVEMAANRVAKIWEDGNGASSANPQLSR